jgi:hypothetical protein
VDAAGWASVAVTLVLGIAGFILARNIGRDLKLRLAERRLAAYERLWVLMRPASPYSQPLDTDGLQRMHSSFTDWYYENGDGMMLEQLSRNVYFEAKDNLIRPVEEITPEESHARLRRLSGTELEAERGRLAQRQLSLLRIQLKSDLRAALRAKAQRRGQSIPHALPRGHRPQALERGSRPFCQRVGPLVSLRAPASSRVM